MSLREPQMRNQQCFFPELLEDKIKKTPHAARFFVYLAGIPDLNLYKKQTMGTQPYNRPTLIAVLLYDMYSGHFVIMRLSFLMEPPQLLKADNIAFSSIMAGEAPARVNLFFIYPTASDS